MDQSILVMQEVELHGGAKIKDKSPQRKPRSLSAQDQHALVPFANHVTCENNIVGKSNFTVSDI